MAGPFYVRSSDGADASDGLSWTNAKATLAGALATAAAGERIWVSQAHAETQASAMTLTSAGTPASPVEILCGNDAAEPPTALATTATVTTTGASALTIDGSLYCYGITFACATGASAVDMTLGSSGVDSYQVFDACAFSLLTTSSRTIFIGASGTARARRCLWVNCIVTFGAVGQGIVVRIANFQCIKGSVNAAGSIPTNLFLASTSQIGTTRFRGVDLSALTVGKSLVAVSSSGGGSRAFEDCHLGASVSLTSGSHPGPGTPVSLDNSDSADTNYRMQRNQYEGDVYSETTIVRTGGASDGTTPLAHRMVSSANSKFVAPLPSPEYVRWNETVGSAVTVTVEIVHDSVTALKDAEIWLEVEYLGTSGVPLSLFADDRAASIIATPANQTASSVTWTTTGLTNPNKQALAVSFTPQEKGLIRARAMLAKASYTVYVDPLMTVA